MPEQLTRHPETTIRVLRSAGARCGEGAPQKILTKCPSERFCRLPRGEMCIYGLEDAGNMTQISPAEWKALLPVVTDGPLLTGSWLTGGTAMGGVVGLIAGMVIGLAVARIRRRASRAPR